MNEEQQEAWDRFTDEAAHAVSEVWEKNGGDPMSFSWICEVNDLLSAHFYPAWVAMQTPEEEEEDD